MVYFCDYGDPDGYIQISQSSSVNIHTVSDATQYCATQGWDYAGELMLGDQTLVNIINELMQSPTADDLQQIWMTGFALPVICYLTAWGFQTVIGWFETRG